MKKNAIDCFVIFLLVSLLLILFYPTESKDEQNLYCKMVGLYESDENLDPRLKNGWPNYKKIDCGKSH